MLSDEEVERHGWWWDRYRQEDGNRAVGAILKNLWRRRLREWNKMSKGAAR